MDFKKINNKFIFLAISLLALVFLSAYIYNLDYFQGFQAQKSCFGMFAEAQTDCLTAIPFCSTPTTVTTNLSWVPFTNADFQALTGLSGISNVTYRIFLGTNGSPGLPGSSVVNVGSATSFSWQNMSQNTTYYWAVAADFIYGGEQRSAETNIYSFHTLNCAPTCTPSCGPWSACSVSCGGGTQTRTCTRADCSTYTETQSCNTQCCNYTFQNGSISPSSVIQGGSYTMGCNYGQTGIDCITVTPPSGSCSFTGWSGPWANFSCTAGSTTGTFTGYCNTVTGTDSKCCAYTNSAGTLTVNPSNNPPSATNLQVSQPDYCIISWPAAIFSWQFTDPDNDTQSAYQVQIDTNSSFSSVPLPVDSGKVSCTPPCSYTTLSGALSWNTTYYWQLKVWDSKDLSSSWVSGPSFATPLHAYPIINFSWTPQNPATNENTQFTDQSTVYGGSTKSSWAWTFQDGNPASSAQQNPIVKFLSAGAKSVTLRVTDSDGFSCQTQKTVNSQLPLPEWMEIPPF